MEGVHKHSVRSRKTTTEEIIAVFNARSEVVGEGDVHESTRNFGVHLGGGGGGLENMTIA